MWYGGFADSGLHAHASQLKDDILTNWSLLHSEQMGESFGYVRGMLIQTGDVQGAEQLEERFQALSPSKQKGAASGACQWLRLAGMLGKATEMFQPDPDDLWGHVYIARCYSAARDFDNSITILKRAIDLSSPGQWTDSHWLRCELAVFLETSGQPVKAKEIYEGIGLDIFQKRDRLHHSFTPLSLICIAKSDRWKDAQSQLDKIETELKKGLARGALPYFAVEDRVGQMLNAAALGLLEEHRGNRQKHIDYFVMANRYRPGTFEQMNGEWISDTVVKLLTEDGQIERLEKILREDVRHRDESLPTIHPERAFTRIRLAQMLVDQNQNLVSAKTLLEEASEVYAYHGDWIPTTEHETLKQLQRTVSTSLEDEK